MLQLVVCILSAEAFIGAGWSRQHSIVRCKYLIFLISAALTFHTMPIFVDQTQQQFTTVFLMSSIGHSIPHDSRFYLLNEPLYTWEFFIFPPSFARIQVYSSHFKSPRFWAYNERKMFQHFITPNPDFCSASNFQSFFRAFTLHDIISGSLFALFLVVYLNEFLFPKKV